MYEVDIIFLPLLNISWLVNKTKWKNCDKNDKN